MTEKALFTWNCEGETMNWKNLWMPLLSLAMLVINGVQLAGQLKQPDGGSPTGTILMTLVWLVLLAFSLRYALSRRKERDKGQGDKKS